MSDVLSEKKADNIVIKNLLKEIQRLKGLNPMGKILLDTNGDLYFAEVYKPFAEIDAENLVQRAKQELAEYESALALSDKLQAQAKTPEPTPEVAAEKAAAPVEQPQPEAPAAQPAPEVTPIPAPEAPAPGVEAPAPAPAEQAASPIVIQ